MTLGTIKGALLGACLALVASSPSHAAVMIQYVNTDFSQGPDDPTGTYTFGFDNSGDFTFKDVSNGQFTFDPVAVMTSGGGTVTALGFPFYDPPQPTTFQDPRGGFNASSFGPDTFFPFLAFPTAATISDSATRFIIGLRDVVAGETYYGFAEVYGTELLTYGFENTPDVAIVTPAPLPSGAPMFGAAVVAFGMVGYAVKRKKAAATA